MAYNKFIKKQILEFVSSRICDDLLYGDVFSGFMEKMECRSAECGHSSREVNVQSSVMTQLRAREYGNGNGNVPNNCKYTH